MRRRLAGPHLRNAITRRTLEEDFLIGEGIQQGLASGANASFRLGRFEGAIAAFHGALEDALEAS